MFALGRSTPLSKPGRGAGSGARLARRFVKQGINPAQQRQIDHQTKPATGSALRKVARE